MFTQPGKHQYRTTEFSTVVQVNSNGFVDAEWPQKNKKRTLIIGDSFVQAAQVPLEDGLGRQLMNVLPEYEILSIGVPGAGTTTAVELAKRYAVELQADSVVLGFLLSNDIFNNHALLDTKSDKPYRKLSGDQLEPYRPINVGNYTVLQESHLFRWAIRTLKIRQINQSRISKDGYPATLDVYKMTPSATWKEAWVITEHLIEELSDWTHQNGIKLGLFLIPVQQEVDTDTWNNTVSKWPILKDHSIEQTHAKALKMMTQIAPTCDLFDAFSMQPSTLYFPKDGHWTALGHKRAAEQLAPFIQRINTSELEMLE
ncbi:MAG: hypothetical protein ACON4U_08690 [Myxococcota bacterium]